VSAVGFARQVLFTYLLRIFLIPLGLVNAVIIARWLGPENQGLFAAVGAYVATAAMLGSLGLAQSASRLVAAEPALLPSLVANARITGALAGIVALAGLLGVRLAFPGAFADVPVILLAVGGLALPLSLVVTQLQALLLGTRRVREYGFMEGLDRVLFFLASLTILVGLGLGVLGLVAAMTLLAGVRLVVYDRLLRAPASAAPDLALLRRSGIVSARAYAASLLAFLVLRSDLMLVQGYLGSASTGVYSIAVQFADLLLVLPVAIGTLLFPRVAAAPSSESAVFTASVSRHAVLAVTAACAAIALAIPWAIPLLFGDAFAGSVPCLWILLPGVWCMAVQGILANDLAGRDYPAFLPWMWLVLLVVNVGLNLALLPRMGIAGAALSSTVAYALSLVLVARHWLRRFPEVPPRSLFFLDRDEIATLGIRIKTALFPPLSRTEGSTP
jgi:O-antigen/teichoic acid export membrane protein